MAAPVAGQREAAMTLKFNDRAAQFNPKTNNVRFYGTDGETEITFAVSQDILADLMEVKSLNERAAVKAFARYRNRIQSAAEKAYLEIGPGSAHAYELAKKHFETAPDPVTAPEAAAGVDIELKVHVTPA
jgi:hypothetical protein